MNMNTKRQLYRDPQKGRIAGVCAGLAEYFGWELWLVRIIFVSGFLLTGGSFFFVGYVVAWFILDKKPGSSKGPSKSSNSARDEWPYETENETKVEVKSRVWQAGEPPIQAFHDIERNFEVLERKLRKMESYVTSSEFQLNREFSKL